jgi:nucleotide-binding universal stress UspA family protein
MCMSKPILVGYDPTTEDHAPVEFALAVARLTGARPIVVSVQAGPRVVPVGTVTQGAPAVIEQPERDLMADCTQALQALEQELAGQGDAECRKLLGSSAARALHEAAEAEDAGLLVVGSSRRGPLGRVVPGSTAARLLRGAPCPVAVVPRAWTGHHTIATVGVAYTGSEEARVALHSAHALARIAGAKLRVVTVVTPGPELYAVTEPRTAERPGKDVTAVEGEARVEAEQALRAAVAELSDDVATEADAFVGDAAEILIELSEQFDLLVCGSRGYGPLRAVILGSVSRRVAGEARCPVIVLPRGATTPLEDLVAQASDAVAP